MGSTAKFSISATIEGLPEQSTSGSGAAFNTTWKSTNAAYTISNVEVSTQGSTAYQSRGVVVPSSATVLYVIPAQSTNPSTAGFRMSETSSTVGVRMGYRGPSIINVESTSESTVYFFTTGVTTYRLRVVTI